MIKSPELGHFTIPYTFIDREEQVEYETQKFLGALEIKAVHVNFLVFPYDDKLDNYGLIVEIPTFLSEKSKLTMVTKYLNDVIGKDNWKILKIK